MRKAIFTATVLSAFLIAGGAFAQNSNQGTPNTVHGSGDMMQDGPHASSNPNADTETGMSHNGQRMLKRKDCEKKWNAAQANGTSAGRSEDQYMGDCMRLK